ncbi:MAG: hypothetical protein AB1646_03595 [Thermodesulfobacteriota bacterium]
MNEHVYLEWLEDIATRLGVELRYENLGVPGIRTEGGLCRLSGKAVILIDRRESRRRKIRILVRALNRMDVDGIFIPPAVRRLLETRTN